MIEDSWKEVNREETYMRECRTSLIGEKCEEKVYRETEASIQKLLDPVATLRTQTSLVSIITNSPLTLLTPRPPDLPSHVTIISTNRGSRLRYISLWSRRLHPMSGRSSLKAYSQDQIKWLCYIRAISLCTCNIITWALETNVKTVFVDKVAKITLSKPTQQCQLLTR